MSSAAIDNLSSLICTATLCADVVTGHRVWPEVRAPFYGLVKKTAQVGVGGLLCPKLAEEVAGSRQLVFLWYVRCLEAVSFTQNLRCQKH